MVQPLKAPPQWEEQVQKKREAIAIVRSMLASGELDAAWLTGTPSANVSGPKTDADLFAEPVGGISQVTLVTKLIEDHNGHNFTIKDLWALSQRKGLSFTEKGAIGNILWKIEQKKLVPGLQVKERGKGRAPTIYRYDA